MDSRAAVGKAIKVTAVKEKVLVERQCYLMLALPLIGFFVFTLYPILWGISKSFFLFNQIPSETRFVGLDNYINLFTKDQAYWSTWITTIKFAVYKLPVEVLVALILAFLLSKVKGAGMMRTIFFMPNIISMVIVGVVFSSMFDYWGIVNAWMVSLGIFKENIEWFANPHTAMLVLVLASTWSVYGINVLYFSAAIAGIPDEVYEAAKIDGANEFVYFFRITIPLIMPVFTTILLLAINGTLQTGEFVVVMTHGAPGGMTHTVGSYIIQSFLPGFAKGSPDIGYGCSISLVSTVVFSTVAIFYSKLTKRIQYGY